MKTFIINIPNEIRNWSNKLDAQAILTSRSWIVFNDEGVKEVYIFRKDGSLIASHNGKVTKAKWEYIAINTSIMIEIPDGDTYMLKPSFYDEKVFMLQVDGTEKFSLMIDENHAKKLALESLQKVEKYIAVKDAQIKTKAKKDDPLYQRRKVDAWTKFIDAKVEEMMNSPEYEKKKKEKKKKEIAFCIALAVTLSFGVGMIIFQENKITSSFCLIGVIASMVVSLIIAMATFIGNIPEEFKYELTMKYPLNSFEYNEDKIS